MTKYEFAIQQSKIAKEVLADLNRTQGRTADGEPDSYNDKASLKIFRGTNNKEMQLKAGYGYYGSSSYYSVSGKDFVDYLIRAINQEMPNIVKVMSKIVLDDEVMAKREARDEAHKVLYELSSE